MTTSELLIFGHITASIIWLGAGFLVALLVFGAQRAGDHVREADHHRDVTWLAPRLFIPASLSTLLLGVLLVIDGAWSFDQLWIVVGLAGWAAAFVLGFFYFRPEGERIGALIDQRGPEDAEVASRLHRLNVVDRAQLLLLFVIVLDMVVKPTGEDKGLLIAGAAILVGAIALGAISIRSHRAAAV